MSEEHKNCTEAHHELELLGKAMGPFWSSIAGGIGNTLSFLWGTTRLTGAQANIELMFEFIARYMEHLPECEGLIIVGGEDDDEEEETN